MNRNRFIGNLVILTSVVAIITLIVGLTRSIALQSFGYFVGTLILTAVMCVGIIALEAMVETETKENL